MPRLRLSSVERRRRHVESSTRWRQRARAYEEPSQPFVHTSFPTISSRAASQENAGPARNRERNRTEDDIRPAAISQLPTDDTAPGNQLLDGEQQNRKGETGYDSPQDDDFQGNNFEDVDYGEATYQSQEAAGPRYLGSHSSPEELLRQERDSSELPPPRPQAGDESDEAMDLDDDDPGSGGYLYSDQGEDGGLTPDNEAVAHNDLGDSSIGYRTDEESIASSDLHDDSTGYPTDDESIAYSDLHDRESVTIQENSDQEQEAGDEENIDEVDDTVLLDAQLQGTDDAGFDFAPLLGRHLVQFQGCSLEEHEAEHTRHHDEAQEPTSHLTLDTYNKRLIDAKVPYVINKKGFMRAKQRAACPLPDWALAFEGGVAGSAPNGGESGATPAQDGLDEAGNHNRAKVTLCLSCSQVDKASARAYYDIDSFLGFVRSPAFASQGLTITFFPRFADNFQTNLKIFLLVYHDFGKGERAMKVPLYQVPHYCLGRVLGHEDMTVYVFFPRMYDPEKPTNFPGKDDGETHGLLRKWTDKILLPALFRYVPAPSRQHYPSSWETARRKARAYYTERQAKSAGGEATVQALKLHYPVRADVLAAAWQDIKRMLEAPEWYIYHGVQLFFSSKNTKLRFQHSTLARVWEAFSNTLSNTVDFTYIDRDRVWIDLGKETAARQYVLPCRRAGADSMPITYLMRSCCQSSFVQWISQEDKAHSVKAKYYPLSMLRDVCNMTAEMSRSSLKREQGWVSSQVYNSCKELYDAAKTKPFDSPFLSRLAWDPQVAKMLKRLGKGSPASDSQIESGYDYSKSRLFCALMAACSLSYGVREEHRISLNFFDRLKESLQTTGDWEVRRVLTAADYAPFWELKMKQYIMYLTLNTNKFLAAFEWIRCSGEAGRVDYEHCKAMTMLLEALPFTFDTGLEKSRTEIWKEQFQRRRGGPFVLGMGLSKTSLATGYGWLLPLMDWEQMAFRPQFRDKVAFASSMLHDCYRKNWGRVKEAKDDFGRLEVAGRWLGLYQNNLDCLEYTLRFMLISIMQSYRKEVFHHLRDMLRPGYGKEARQGRIMLCYNSIVNSFDYFSARNINVVYPNRTKTRTTRDLVSLLWGFDDGRRRERWEDAPFRVLCRRALELIEAHCGLARREHFHDTVQRYFIATHWFIPHSTSTKFISKNRQLEVQWISVFHRRLAKSKAKSYQTVSAWALIPTTKPHPTRYRPAPRWRKSREWIEKQPRKSDDVVEWHYMEDWSLSYGMSGPIMDCYPKDIEGDGVPFDSDLDTIGRQLDTWWQSGRQAGAAEE